MVLISNQERMRFRYSRVSIISKYVVSVKTTEITSLF